MAIGKGLAVKLVEGFQWKFTGLLPALLKLWVLVYSKVFTLVFVKNYNYFLLGKEETFIYYSDYWLRGNFPDLLSHPAAGQYENLQLHNYILLIWEIKKKLKKKNLVE